MDNSQMAAQLSNHAKVPEVCSKTLDITLIVRSNKGRYPCPSKDCNKDYSRASYTRSHYKRVHLHVDMRVPCPNTECGKSFFDLRTANEHHKAAHELVRYNCPADDCEDTFTCPKYAQKHYRAVHLNDRITCSFPGCTDTFSFAAAMRTHMKNVHSPRWMCPVENCANTVSKHGVSHNQIVQHMERHKRLDHLTALENPAPKQLASVSTDIAARREELKTLLLAYGVSHVQDRSESEDILYRDSDAESESSSDNECESDDFAMFFGVENEEIIKMANQLYQPVANSNSLLKRNLEIAKLFPNKVNYQNYGLECIGSGWLVDGLINGSCPGKTILTFETARLVMRRTETSARFPHGHPLLPNRCISCGTQYILNSLFLQKGCQKADGQTTCATPKCTNQIWNSARYCLSHLRSSQSQQHNISILKQHLKASMNRHWEANFPVDQAWRILKGVVDGEIPSGRLIFLDIEYDVCSHRVHEVGMCDARGETIVDCFTSLSTAEWERTTLSPELQNDFIASFAVANRRAAKLRNHTHGFMNVHQLVQQVRNVGITPETVVIVWATNSRDLSSIRDWFEAEGYYNILPSDSNCVSMVQPFRTNIGKLPDGRSFPLRLEILFSLFYDNRHELSGRNHHALVDAQQTRLMFMHFINLCNDPSVFGDRLQSIGSEGVLQRSILEFFTTK